VCITLSVVKKERRPMMSRKAPWAGLCRLKEFREGKGLTLRDVEVATGVPNATVSQAERGADLVLSTAMVLADFFGVSVEDIWVVECKHEWTGQQMGGGPDTAEAAEWVGYCKLCGVEKVDD
jgi:transcriptional regulator with XRE-family HTH domain